MSRFSWRPGEPAANACYENTMPCRSTVGCTSGVWLQKRGKTIFPCQGANGGNDMLFKLKAALTAAAVAAVLTGAAGNAAAQSGEPIKIGFSMAMTGGLAPNGKSALLAQRIWEEDVNAKGGLLS